MEVGGDVKGNEDGIVAELPYGVGVKGVGVPALECSALLSQNDWNCWVLGGRRAASDVMRS